MKKSIYLIVALSVLILAGCATNYKMPRGKTQQDFYNDLNECAAMEQRVDKNAYGRIERNCMFGKGYTR